MMIETYLECHCSIFSQNNIPSLQTDRNSLHPRLLTKTSHQNSPKTWSHPRVHAPAGCTSECIFNPFQEIQRLQTCSVS